MHSTIFNSRKAFYFRRHYFCGMCGTKWIYSYGVHKKWHVLQLLMCQGLTNRRQRFPKRGNSRDCFHFRQLFKYYIWLFDEHCIWWVFQELCMTVNQSVEKLKIHRQLIYLPKIQFGRTNVSKNTKNLLILGSHCKNVTWNDLKCAIKKSVCTIKVCVLAIKVCVHHKSLCISHKKSVCTTKYDIPLCIVPTPWNICPCFYSNGSARKYFKRDVDFPQSILNMIFSLSVINVSYSMWNLK